MSLFAEALKAWAGVISLSRREGGFQSCVFTQQMHASARDEIKAQQTGRIKLNKGAGIKGGEAICEGKHVLIHAA